MRAVAQAIGGLETGQVLALAGGDAVAICLDGERIELEPQDVVVERTPREGLVVASEGDLVVALETELTDELVLEGLAREVVNKIQNMRKSAGLEVTQRIEVSYCGDELLAKALAQYCEYVCAETLCTGLSATDDPGADATAWDVNGHECRISVLPAAG